MWIKWVIISEYVKLRSKRREVILVPAPSKRLPWLPGTSIIVCRRRINSCNYTYMAHVRLNIVAIGLPFGQIVSFYGKEIIYRWVAYHWCNTDGATHEMYGVTWKSTKYSILLFSIDGLICILVYKNIWRKFTNIILTSKDHPSSYPINFASYLHQCCTSVAHGKSQFVPW